MKTLVAIPCMDMMHTAFVQDLMQLDFRPLGEVAIHFRPNSLVYDSRNILALDAIREGFDQILWLDSDMSFPRNMAEYFQDVLTRFGADMVTGVYFKRKLPTQPVLYKSIVPPRRNKDGIAQCSIETYTDYPKDQIFPVAGCGFGAVLMRTDLCKRIIDKFGPAFYPFVWAGEDISFCYQANRIGAKILCDSRIHIGHIGLHLYNDEDYKPEDNADE